MTASKIIFALHGFLGEPSDFLFIQKSLPPEFKFVPVDYMSIESLNPTVDLENWGANFNNWVSQFAISPETQKVILGYSQGGRLALHALKNNSSIWDQAVLVSVNPGIPDAEKKTRRASDENWAKRFLEEDFRKVLNDWNAQTVFKGGCVEPNRKVPNRKELLAKALTIWSLSSQQDFRIFLKSADMNMTWVAGKLDEKFSRIASEIKVLNPQIQTLIIEKAAHRVLFDQPESLAKLLL